MWNEIKRDVEPHFLKRPHPIETGPWKGKYMWSQGDENGFIDILKSEKWFLFVSWYNPYDANNDAKKKFQEVEHTNVDETIVFL